MSKDQQQPDGHPRDPSAKHKATPRDPDPPVKADKDKDVRGKKLGPCAGHPTMADYPPAPEALRGWMNHKKLSNKDVAKALRLSDGRVVRFWTSKKKPRAIPYPSWYTLRHKFGD